MLRGASAGLAHEFRAPDLRVPDKSVLFPVNAPPSLPLHSPHWPLHRPDHGVVSRLLGIRSDYLRIRGPDDVRVSGRDGLHAGCGRGFVHDDSGRVERCVSERSARWRRDRHHLLLPVVHGSHAERGTRDRIGARCSDDAGFLACSALERGRCATDSAPADRPIGRIASCRLPRRRTIWG